MSAIGNPQSFKYVFFLNSQALDGRRNSCYFAPESSRDAANFNGDIQATINWTVENQGDDDAAVDMDTSSSTEDATSAPFADVYGTAFLGSFSNVDTLNVVPGGSQEQFDSMDRYNFLRFVCTGSPVKVTIISNVQLVLLF